MHIICWSFCAALAFNNLSIIGSQHNPHFTEGQSDVIVQLFEWKFDDIAEECERLLGPKGYGGVQVSPVSENLVIRTETVKRPWWERYQPISYKIDTRSGNEEQFRKMIKRCNDAGVRVYVDIVLNHMAAPQYKEVFQNNKTIKIPIEMIGTAGSYANASILQYPAVPYTPRDFHHPPCTVDNYYEAHEIRNCQFNSSPDLDHSLESVREQIIDFLNRLIDSGVAGFRIDSAKYIWPIDIKIIWSRLKNLNEDFDFPKDSRPFVLQELIDSGGEAISKTEYNENGVVTEFQYSSELGSIFNGHSTLSTLINLGPAMGFLPHAEALVFVDSHDIQRGKGLGGNLTLTYKERKKHIMAVAFMLAHPYGMPRIMSSYDFNSIDEGPPYEKSGDEDDDDDDDSSNNVKNNNTRTDNVREKMVEEKIISPEINDQGQCVNDWICEHRWPSISNMIEFRNITRNQPVIYWENNGPNQISFCRGNKGFIAFNNEKKSDYDFKEFPICLEPGDYCDVISGAKIMFNIGGDKTECSGKKIHINENGKMNFVLPFDDEYGVVAIHADSKIPS